MGFLFALATFAQTDITWEMLGEIRYEKEYLEEYDLDYDKPIFSQELKEMDQKEVSITGFLLPIDVAGNYFILSKFPYSSCFFCSTKDNKAGPETVVELQIKKYHDWFQMDDILTFTGKLVLNNSDVNKLCYILENAQVTAE